MQKGALIVYKNQPGLIDGLGEKVDIRLRDGQFLKVRPKDFFVLHPGPLQSLSSLTDELQGDCQEAWELYQDDSSETPQAQDLCELIYGSFTPQTAWALWKQLEDGLFFFGPWDGIRSRSETDRREMASQRQKKGQQKQELAAFLARCPQGPFAEADQRFFSEVEHLALGKSSKSPILRELKIPETPEAAHQFLLDTRHWDVFFNPYPHRLAPTLKPWAAAALSVPDEARQDLTHLRAFAIDNEGSHDPDDALSVEGSRLWVHVADPAALIAPGSELDLGARERIGTLYLPEALHPMLPSFCLDQLGLGLVEISPALSFAIDTAPDSSIISVDVVKSWVRVTRLTYREADVQMAADKDLQALEKLTTLFEERRRLSGSVSIEIPEVKIYVSEREISFTPHLPWKSGALVREAMILAGEAAASFAASRALAFPSIVQEAPDKNPAEVDVPGLAGMYVKRRLMKRRQIRASPGAHAGLGLSGYSQVTSPLRRYLDLVTHQQLRLYLAGQTPLSESEILERVGAVEAAGSALRQTESLSKKHWTLAYLSLHPEWQDEAIVVQIQAKWAQVFVPSLGLEADLFGGGPLELNQVFPVKVSKLQLSQLLVQLVKA